MEALKDIQQFIILSQQIRRKWNLMRKELKDYLSFSQIISKQTTPLIIIFNIDTDHTRFTLFLLRSFSDQ